MKLHFIILLSIVVQLSYAQQSDSLTLKGKEYPPPMVKLKYMDEPFTNELIIKKSFREHQLVPVVIELIKPEMTNAQSPDLYVTIESVRVTFIIKENGPLYTSPFKGHLVIIPITWPQRFVLEPGSRIAFIIKYNYHLKKEIVETGEVIEQIRF